MAADDGDIPLTKFPTASSVGARKHNQGGVSLDAVRSSSQQVDHPSDEKHGIFHHHSSRLAGRRRIKKEDTATGGISRSSTDSEVALNFMGKLYTRIINTSIVTRYLIYVIPVAFLLAIPLVILPLTDNTKTIPLGHYTDTTTSPSTTVDGPPLFHLFIWLESTWAGLWAAKLVAHLVPAAFMFFCGVVSSGTRKYATVLRALEIPLSLFFWGLEAWLTFKFLFSNSNFQWIYVIKNILGSLFVSSAIFLIEKAFVQLISITYHQRSFANRIAASKHEIYLLGLMYEASRTLFPMYCREFANEDYIINDSIEAMLSSKWRGGSKNVNNTGKPHGRKSSVAPVRIIGNVGRIGDKVTSIFGNLASEITGKQVFNPNSAHSIVVEALEKARSSEAMARRIWMSFVVEDSDSLSLDDFEEVLGPAHKAEAEECFLAIDADGNGDISLEEMVRKVVEIGKERKAISNSMKDISQALAVFDQVLLFVVLLITIFIFLAFFQSSFISTLTTAGTTLLSLSFIFSVTAQEFLGSCIFLFVKHPYDVGDRVDINGPEKEQLIVEKISLLFTVFVRIEHMQVVQVPNIKLNDLWIENVTRSHAMREVVDVNVSYDTSFEDIELLCAEMETFVRHPDNARDFMPDVGISVGGVNDLDKLTLKITMKHKSNWHNDLVRATRRSKFMCALALALKKVPINTPGGGDEALGSAGNANYTVAVSATEAETTREKMKKEKNAKRLVPLIDLDSDDDKDTKSAEKRAVRHLNATDPMTDAAEGWGAAMDDADDYTLRDPSSESRPGNLAPSASQSRARSRSRSHSLAYAPSLRNQTSLQHLPSIASAGSTASRSQRGRRQAGTGLGSHAALTHETASSVNRQPSMARSYRSGTGGVMSSSFDIEHAAGGVGVRPSMDEGRFAIPPPPMPQPMPQPQLQAQVQDIHPLQSAPPGSSAGRSQSRRGEDARGARK